MQAITDLGYTVRPATLDDIDQAVTLFNTCSQETLGKARFDLNAVRTEWRTPNFDLATDTRMVFDSTGTLVGYGEVWDVEEPHVKVYSWGRVHPEHRGLGVGSAILSWIETRAAEAVPRAPADAQVTLGQVVEKEDENARTLLEGNNYDLVRHFYRMRIDFEGTLPEPAWPEGVDVRTFDPEVDLEPTVLAVRDAFQDHWGHVDSPFEEELKFWRQWIDDDEDHDPTLWFLAVEAGEIVGMSLCQQKDTEIPELGWINVLGVRRPWRRRRIALALLHPSFRALEARGKRGAGLGVDATSLTGANRLYERAGMRTFRRSDAHEKVLRPGIDLRLQTLGDSSDE